MTLRLRPGPSNLTARPVPCRRRPAWPGMQRGIAPEGSGFELEQPPSEGELLQGLDVRRHFGFGALLVRRGALFLQVLEDLAAKLGSVDWRPHPLPGGCRLFRSELGEEAERLRLLCEPRSLLFREGSIACGALVSACDFQMLFRREGHVGDPSCRQERHPFSSWPLRRKVVYRFRAFKGARKK